MICSSGRKLTKAQLAAAQVAHVPERSPHGYARACTVYRTQGKPWMWETLDGTPYRGTDFYMTSAAAVNRARKIFKCNA